MHCDSRIAVADVAAKAFALRIAQHVKPPLRTHRHRYYGVLAANSPFRAAVVAPA